MTGSKSASVLAGFNLDENKAPLSGPAPFYEASLNSGDVFFERKSPFRSILYAALIFYIRHWMGALMSSSILTWNSCLRAGLKERKQTTIKIATN